MYLADPGSIQHHIWSESSKSTEQGISREDHGATPKLQQKEIKQQKGFKHTHMEALSLHTGMF